MSRVVTVVVTYCSADHIGPCLESLRAASTGPVVVVDNASADGTAALVRERYPWVRLVASPVNLGFARGVNRGMRERPDSEFYFVLNPDALVLPGTVDALVRCADARPAVGIVGARVYDDTSLAIVQRSFRRFPRLRNAFFNRHSVLSRWFAGNRVTRDYLYEDLDPVDPSRVDWVSGCAMLVRRRFLEEVGPFDEGFFFFCEDVDLCWRARKRGWDVWYCPGGGVVHHVGKSAEHAALRTIVAKNRSMLRLYRKHIRRTVLTDPLVVAGAVARTSTMVLAELGRRAGHAVGVRRQGA